MVSTDHTDPEKTEYPTTREEMLEAARKYTEMGLIIHPLTAPNEEGKKPGKTPIEREWQNRSSSRNEHDLNKYWGKNSLAQSPPYNIGLQCGKRSGITVIDLDDMNPAILNDLTKGVNIDDWIMSKRTLERAHLFFKYNPALKAVKKHLIGIEVLTDGNNAVLPPSNHKTGTAYKLVKCEVKGREDFPEMPEVFTDRIRALFKTCDKLQAAINKSRLCLRNSITSQFEEPDSKRWHGATGRDITLAVMAELYANGAGEDGLTLACKGIFRETFDPNETQEQIESVIRYFENEGKPWTCDNLRNKCGYITTDPDTPDKSMCETCRNRVTTKHADLNNFSRNSGMFYSALADICIEKYHVKTLEGGDLRIYEEGIYPEIKNNYRVNYLVLETANEHGIPLTPNQIKTTIEMIKTKTPASIEDGDLNKIAVSNGILDVTTGEFMPHSPDFVFSNKLPVKYDPKAPEPKMFLETLSRTFKGVEHQIPTIQEIFGYCLLRKYPIAAVFFLLGDGKNGKSVILKIMSSMLGDENTSGLTLLDMAQPKNEHVLMDLKGKYANICGDVGKKKIDDTAFLKMLTGRDKIRARGLYKDAITFVNHAKAIFALNQLPEIEDFSDGFKRRIKIIEFPNRFDGTEEIAELDEAIVKAGELSGVLNWSLEGLHRLLDNNKFSNEKTVAEAGLEYDMKSNPVSYFVRACIDEDPNYVERTETLLYSYMEYRKKYLLPTLSKKEFKNKLINACREVGINTSEKRHRPSGGENADRYYGFIGIKVNKADLNKCIGEQGEDSPIKSNGKEQTEFKQEFVGEELDKRFHRDLSVFLRERHEVTSRDAHSAALMFCEAGMAGYKAAYGIEFIENEIKRRTDLFTNFQRDSPQ